MSARITSPTAQKHDADEIHAELEIGSIEALKALANPLRVRVLRALMPRAGSAKQVSQLLGEGVTKLYRHLKILEEHGFIRPVGQAVVSGIAEVHYRARARSFVISRSALAEPGSADSPVDSALSFVLDQTRSSIQRALAQGCIDLHARAPDPRALLARRTFAKLAPAQARAFYQRVLALYEEFGELSDTSGPAPPHAADDNAGKAELYTLTFALFPTDNSHEDSGAVEAPLSVASAAED
jgi:DNA-binding transcriptional ArsR family regulator